MNATFRRYAPISKVEEQADGTIKVWGYASSASEDSDGEVITPEAIKAALPDYMKFGAVREMHKSTAAGTAIDAEVMEDGRTFFGAHVVDAAAVQKVQLKVYKGFSVGGKVLGRDKDDATRITKLKLIEVSLVDRPANPDAVFTMYKVEGAEAESEPVPATVADPAPSTEAPVVPPVEPAAKAEVTPLDRESINALGELMNKGAITPGALLAAAQAVITPPVIEPRKKVMVIDCKKGMSALSQFASILQNAAWLGQDAACEASWEGDASPIPESLRDWIAVGIGIFQNMTAEESNELLAGLTAALPAPMVALAAEPDDVQKAGARFSSATKTLLADMHKSMKDCCAKFDAMGYMNSDKAEAAEVVKIIEPAVVQPTAGDLLKSSLVSTTEAMLKSALDSRDVTIADLTKRLKAIEDQPMPAKGVVSSVAISKGADGGSEADGPGVGPIMKGDGTVDEAATLMKIIHRAGSRIPV